MLVSADDGGVDPKRPLIFLGVTATLEFGQHHLPGAVGRPTPMPVVDGLPRPVRDREIPPRRTCPGPPQHPVDHRSVIPPRTPTPRRPIRQQRLQHSPLSISQVMAVMHTTCLPQPAANVYRTRPSTSGRCAAARTTACSSRGRRNGSPRAAGRLGDRCAGVGVKWTAAPRLARSAGTGGRVVGGPGRPGGRYGRLVSPDARRLDPGHPALDRATVGGRARRLSRPDACRLYRAPWAGLGLADPTGR